MVRFCYQRVGFCWWNGKVLLSKFRVLLVEW